MYVTLANVLSSKVLSSRKEKEAQLANPVIHSVKFHGWGRQHKSFKKEGGAKLKLGDPGDIKLFKNAAVSDTLPDSDGFR